MKRARSKSKQKKSDSRSDFPKKKRKLGKGKAPPDNATDISFKSRTISIPSQLERDESEPSSSKKKLPLQTLLTHLEHYRTSVRLEALVGMHDLLQEHPELLLPNLSKILQRSLVTFTDSERVVRHALHKLLKLVFSQISEKQIAPFLSVVVAHLHCGLTHITDSVQLDSLKLFDLLLELYPSLLVPHAQELLTLLINLLSHNQNLFVSGGNKSRKTVVSSLSSLTSDPSSKLSKYSSRMETFIQLQKLFQLLLASTEEEGKNEGAVLCGHGVKQDAPVIDVHSRKILICKDGIYQEIESGLCDLTKPIPQVAILKNYGIQIPKEAYIDQWLEATGSVGEVHSSSVQGMQDEFMSSIHKLISLLLESWVECSPSKFVTPGHAVSKKCMELMEVVLGLLALVLKLVVRLEEMSEEKGGGRLESLQRKFSDDFRKHFLAYFPFPFSHSNTSTTNSSSSSRPGFVFGRDDATQGTTGLTMNFTFCEVVLNLFSKCSSTEAITTAGSGSAAPFCSAVCAFLSDLTEHFTLVSSQSQLLVPVAQTVARILPLLLESATANAIPDSSLEKVLSGVFFVYNGCHTQSSAKQVLVQCFTRILSGLLREGRSSCSSLVMVGLLLPWLQTLPQFLLRLGDSNVEASSRIIDVLSVSVAVLALEAEQHRHEPSDQRKFQSLLHQQHTLMCAQLDDTIFKLFDPSSGPAHKLLPGVQRKLLELLWHLPSLGLQGLTTLVQCVFSGLYDASVMKYLVQIVHHKLAGSTSSETTAHYLSFMLTLSVGYTQKQLSVMPSKNGKEETQFPLPISLIKPQTACSEKYRMEILKDVCENLQSVAFSDEILSFLKPRLQELLKSKVLPFDSAVGLLNLFKCLAPESSVPVEDLVHVIAQLCYTCLVSLRLERPMESQHPLAVECSETVITIICGVQEVACALLKQFQSAFSERKHCNEESKEALECEYDTVLGSLLVGLLNDPHTRTFLRGISGEIHKTIQLVQTRISPSSALREHLDLAAERYKS